MLQIGLTLFPSRKQVIIVMNLMPTIMLFPSERYLMCKQKTVSNWLFYVYNGSALVVVTLFCHNGRGRGRQGNSKFFNMHYLINKYIIFNLYYNKNIEKRSLGRVNPRPLYLPRSRLIATELHILLLREQWALTKSRVTL